MLFYHVLSWIYALIMGIEQNLAKSIQARIFTSGEISGFRMISSLNHFRPKFWTEGDLGISLSLSLSLGDKIHGVLKASYRPISEIHAPGSRSRCIQSNLRSFISNDAYMYGNRGCMFRARNSHVPVPYHHHWCNMIPRSIFFRMIEWKRVGDGISNTILGWPVCLWCI